MNSPLKLGLYEQLISEKLDSLVGGLPEAIEAKRQKLDVGESHERLARYVYEALCRSLGSIEQKDRIQDQIALVNDILALVRSRLPDAVIDGEQVSRKAQMLTAIYDTTVNGSRPEPPLIPLSASALIVNDGERMSVGASIKRELLSADGVDLICAFINYTGIRILESEVRALCTRGRFRLITTTYMGATQRKALDLLAEWGAEIKLTFEVPPANTKLHAKAWMFYRNTEYHTAYIGSSNISHSALIDGLEWNVRLSQVDAQPILDKFRSTFERYWHDRSFEEYDPERDSNRLDRALNASRAVRDNALEFFLDLEPRPHQREILEMLQVERERHDRWRNLVVAATGTGKTVIAALDYKRLYREWREPTLLFVAHRKEILDQSRSTFRMALRDGAFGERWVDGDRPAEFRHVFASIQSLSQFDLTLLPPDHFDIVIVDEFHHAEAATYQRLLDYVRPRLLLGLTATPERADGKDVRDLFGGKSTVELRLWDALDQGLLCPFQYFGISDNTDLSGVDWSQGRYSVDGLDEVYVTRGEARAGIVYEQTNKIVEDIRKMRALGFCVSIRHARFMTEQFRKLQIECASIDANTDAEERASTIRKLKDGKINIIFAVDIFNEGIDLPEVDTVLFLRPTESATVYIQQLGRGLRLNEGKRCLTVLDFIGQQHQKFRFEFRYRAMTGCSRTELQSQLEAGFPRLPAGCNIQLDRHATQTILENLKAALPQRKAQMIRELRRLASDGQAISLERFLNDTGLEPSDLYRGGRYFTDLKRQAGVISEAPGAYEPRVGRAMERLLAVDNPERVDFYRETLSRGTPPRRASLPVRQQRMLFMLVYAMLQDFKLPELDGAIERFWREERMREEAQELIGAMAQRSERLPLPLSTPELADVPLDLHATYSRDDIVAAFGRANPAAMREGVMHAREHRCDVFLITLRKSEGQFSPTTRYHDYPIAPDLFHWESQSTTLAASDTGRRYISHREQGSRVLLMAREAKSQDGRTAPYTCLGTAQYVEHESERPMRIIWKLDHAMPETLFQQFRTAAG